MLVRHIDVRDGACPVTVTIGSAVIVLRRVGERSVTVAIEAPREVPIGFVVAPPRLSTSRD